MKAIIEDGKVMMKECKDAVFDIFEGTNIPKENLVACINSLFIWYSKEKYFESSKIRRG